MGEQQSYGAEQSYVAFVEQRLVVLHTGRRESYCTEMLVRMIDLVLQQFWTGNKAKCS